MVKSKKEILPNDFLEKFSEICKKSKTPDGDWQGDGWGIAFLERSGKWKIRKFSNPIWEKKEIFKNFPKTKLFLVHARSAHSKSNLGTKYNQPYVNQNFAFVFNGFLGGVSLPFKVKGEIGAQKIWNLLKKLLEKNSPERALKKLKDFLKEKSKKIEGLNIGVSDKKYIFALCYYQTFPEYYTLYYGNFKNLKIVCSENLENLRKMKNNQIRKF